MYFLPTKKITWSGTLALARKNIELIVFLLLLISFLAGILIFYFFGLLPSRQIPKPEIAFPSFSEQKLQSIIEELERRDQRFESELILEEIRNPFQ